MVKPQLEQRLESLWDLLIVGRPLEHPDERAVSTAFSFAHKRFS